LEQKGMKKIKNCNNKDILTVLSFNDKIDNPTFLAIEKSKINGNDIINIPSNEIVEKLDITPEMKDIVKQELNKFVKANNSTKLDKKLEDWSNENLIDFLKETTNLASEQLEILSTNKIDGLDLMTHFHDELKNKVGNNKEIFNELKVVKGIASLEFKVENSDLTQAIIQLKIENNKLYAENLSLQEMKQILEKKVNQNEQESTSIQSN